MIKFQVKKNRTPDLAAIHEYTLDLQRITVLRDKCEEPEERKLYDSVIHVMQEILVYLNSLSR